MWNYCRSWSKNWCEISFWERWTSSSQRYSYFYTGFVDDEAKRVQDQMHKDLYIEYKEMAVELDFEAIIPGQYAKTVHLRFSEIEWETEEVQIHTFWRVYIIDQQLGWRSAWHLWEDHRELQIGQLILLIIYIHPLPNFLFQTIEHWDPTLKFLSFCGVIFEETEQIYFRTLHFTFSINSNKNY